MDASETYIKMCDCKEIQGERLPDTYFQDGDWWVSKRWKDAVPCAWRGYRGTEDVWLPRQDQLQEMVGDKNIFVRLIDFIRWCFDTGMNWVHRNNSEQFTSMEQLWLGYAMSEKYKKEWNGKDWVKTK